MTLLLSALRDSLRRRVTEWSFLFLVLSVLLTLAPGFDVLSFYFCLPISLLEAVACGGVAITAISRARTRNATLWRGVWNGTAASLIFLAIPLAVVTVSAWIAGPCDYVYGLLFYLSGPVASAACGLAFGTLIAAFVRGPRLALALFLCGVAATFVADAVHLYREPAVFFYNPFLGWYPGPIYDDLLRVEGPYVAFRLWCLAACGAGLSLVAALVRPDFAIRPSRRPWPWAACGAFAGMAVTLWSLAGHFGFRVTAADVEAVLPAVAADAFCEIRHDGSLPPSQVSRLLADCGFRHRQAAAFFGLEPGHPIRAWFYPDAAVKARLMGARDVDVTKPWLGEVHLDVPLPGDPVLGHEIAHVVAGRLAPGLLAVPTDGLLPDMGRVEGLAVAAMFAADGPSPHEWALAMARAGVDNDPAPLFGGTRFVVANAHRAYTVAGSFLRFVADVHGPAALRAIAAGEDFETATGRDIETLVREWRAFLEQTVAPRLSPEVVRMASGRFSGPGVLGRRCPVDTARVLDRANAALSAGEYAEAATCLGQALGHRPGDRGLLRLLVRISAMAGNPTVLDAAVSTLVSANASPNAPAPDLDRLPVADRLAIGDALALPALQAGLPPSWETRTWTATAARDAEVDADRRAAAARLHALDLSPEAGEAVFRVLSGLDPGPADLALSNAVAVAPDSWIVRYLSGRALAGVAAYADAKDQFEAALALGVPPGTFEAETEKALGKAAFWAGDVAAARTHLSRALELATHEGDRMVVEEYLERIRACSDRW